MQETMVISQFKSNQLIPPEISNDYLNISQSLTNSYVRKLRFVLTFRLTSENALPLVSDIMTYFPSLKTFDLYMIVGIKNQITNHVRNLI
jgi:hypothetical protein